MIPLISMKFLIPLALPILSCGMRSGQQALGGTVGDVGTELQPQVPDEDPVQAARPTKQEKEEKIEQGADQDQGAPSSPPGAPIVANRPADGLQDHGDDQPEEGQCRPGMYSSILRG